MSLQSLILTNFRNFTQQSFQFDPRLTVIQGANGAGKTAILEAIYYLTHGRSFRSKQYRPLIHHEAQAFIIRAQITQEELTQQIAVQKTRHDETRLRQNGQNVASHASFARLLPVMLINPEMLHWTMEHRHYRRQILDWGVYYEEASYASEWQQFQRILIQRNQLLKQKQFRQMATWNHLLISAAEKVHQSRLAYMEKFIAQVKQTLGEFCKQHDIEVDYYPGWSQKQSFTEALEAHYSMDCEHGYTHAGPHRADLRLRIGTQSVKALLSRGQQKKLLCGLRICQGQLLLQKAQQALVLLDDLTAELDASYQHYLLDQLQQLSHQVVVTTLQPPPFTAQTILL